MIRNQKTKIHLKFSNIDIAMTSKGQESKKLKHQSDLDRAIYDNNNARNKYRMKNEKMC